MSVDVTIAINSYRSPELIRNCLGSLERAFEGVAIHYELLVADSATEAETQAIMASEFSTVFFLPNKENVGFKTLVNQSIASAKGEYLFLINADIEVTPEVIPGLLAYARANPQVGIVGPRQLGNDRRSQVTAFRFYRVLTILFRRSRLGGTRFGRRHLDWFEMRDHADDECPFEVGWLMGSALFISKANAIRLGPMDDRFFMYMEDVDWCRRAWDMGMKVVCHPGYTVFHRHERASARGGLLGSLFNPMTRHHIASALRYFYKYRGTTVPDHF